MPIDPEAVRWLLAELRAGRSPSLSEMKSQAPDSETLKRLESIRSGYPLDNTWRAGEIVDRFELIQRLGHGGFGEVWLAKESLFDGDHSIVVLKCPLNKPNSNPATVTLKRISTRSMIADLTAGFKIPTHPYITTYLGITIQKGCPILVMEFANQGSVADRIQGTNMLKSWAELFRWAAQSAWGIDFIHSHRLIHQDIKPSNILLHETLGTINAKVCDFGLVQSPDKGIDDSSPSPTARTQGMTRDYASPEQLRGDLLHVTTDTYSWAKTWKHYAMGDPDIELDPEDLSQWKACLGTPRDNHAAFAFLRLLNECLTANPFERPRLSEVAYAIKAIAEWHDPNELKIDLPRRVDDKRKAGQQEWASQSRLELNIQTTAELLGYDADNLSVMERRDSDAFISSLDYAARRILGFYGVHYFKHARASRLLTFVKLAGLNSVEELQTERGRIRSLRIACALLELFLAGHEAEYTHSGKPKAAAMAVLGEALYILNQLRKHGGIDKECKTLLALVLKEVWGQTPCTSLLEKDKIPPPPDQLESRPDTAKPLSKRNLRYWLIDLAISE